MAFVLRGIRRSQANDFLCNFNYLVKQDRYFSISAGNDRYADFDQWRREFHFTALKYFKNMYLTYTDNEIVGGGFY